MKILPQNIPKIQWFGALMDQLQYTIEFTKNCQKQIKILSVILKTCLVSLLTV